MKKYFILLFVLVLFLTLCACTNPPNKSMSKCKSQVISEKYDNKNQSLRFSATPTSSEKLIFTNSTGDLASYTMNESFTNGIPLKNWTIYEDASSDLCLKKNDGSKNFCVSSSTPSNYSIKLGSTVLDVLSLNKQKHLDLLAGWAMDGLGTTLPVYVGSYKLVDQDWGDVWLNDRIDVVYVNKGFKITLFEHTFEGIKAELENKDLDIPKRFMVGSLGMQDKATSIKAEWVGY